MIKIPKNLLQSAPASDLADYIVRNFNIYEIAESLAESLKDREETDKVSITVEQFRKFFSIRGVSDIRFERESRGRKPITAKAIALAEEREEKTFKDNGE